MEPRSGVDRTDEESIDADRFRSLYDRHLRAVTVYCARRLDGARVQDAVAETFLVTWRRIDDVPDGDAALLWLYRVASRVVGHDRRGAGRRVRLTARLVSRASSTPPTPEEAAIDGDDTRRVLEAAGRLRASDAEILGLHAWEQLDALQIASVLEITPNAVHQRLHRARQHRGMTIGRGWSAFDTDRTGPSGVSVDGPQTDASRRVGTGRNCSWEVSVDDG